MKLQFAGLRLAKEFQIEVREVFLEVCEGADVKRLRGESNLRRNVLSRTPRRIIVPPANARVIVKRRVVELVVGHVGSAQDGSSAINLLLAQKHVLRVEFADMIEKRGSIGNVVDICVERALGRERHLFNWNFAIDDD